MRIFAYAFCLPGPVMLDAFLTEGTWSETSCPVSMELNLLNITLLFNIG